MTKLSSPLPEETALKARPSSDWRIMVASVVIVVLLVVSIAVVEYDGYRSSAAVSSESSVRSASAEGISENAQFVTSLGNQTVDSVPGILKFYTNSSVLTWEGNITSGFRTSESPLAPFNQKGTYTGLSEIGGLYGSALMCFVSSGPFSLTASVSNLTLTAVGGNSYNSTFVLILNGQCQPLEIYGATANVEQRWTRTDGIWTIARESWDFLETSAQFTGPNPGGPAGAG